jgi:hypothetical protein
MPFDSAEFFAGSSSDERRRLAWPARLALALARAFHKPLPPEEKTDDAVLRILEEARGLIEQREDWTRGSYATMRGERCAVGALREATQLLDYRTAGERAHRLLTLIAIGRGYSSIEAMNDSSRHEHVLAAFDAAIVAAKRQLLGAR